MRPAPNAVTTADEDARAIEATRETYREWLAGPESFLAAVSRHEVPIGHALRFGAEGEVKLADAGASLVVAATEDGFRVDGIRRGPGIVRLGRYRLRLSHQNAPAVIVLDPEAPRQALAPRWYPYDASFRFTLALEPNPAPIALGSTRERDRAAERVGWFAFKIGGAACRVAVTRLLEPGVPPDLYQVFFRDLTSGHRTYGLGRYLDVTPAAEEKFLVDFNRAYNPACAFSAHYNCPVPPDENRLHVAMTAGEMGPQ